MAREQTVAARGRGLEITPAPNEKETQIILSDTGNYNKKIILVL